MGMKVLAALMCGTCIVAVATPVQAQSQTFKIPAGNLKHALELYSKQTSAQLMYRADEVASIRSPGVQGVMTQAAALAALLAGTNFESYQDSSGAIAIVRKHGTPVAAMAQPSLNRQQHGTRTSTPEPSNSNITEGGSIEDIVVTAQKREQRLQDVPIAITALTQDALQVNRVANVGDLSGLAPNVIVRPAAGGSAIASFSMRGIVSYGVVPGSDKEVSIYLDGVYISSSQASLFELPDIQRIEVLRGPQGTLFGRNATAGAVSIVTRDPTGTFGVRQDLTIGNYSQRRSRTSVDLPAWGPLSAYVTYVHDERRGDVRNLGGGTVWDRTGPQTKMGALRSPNWLGDKNLESWFAAVRFDPSGAFRMTYKFDHTANRFSQDAQALVGIDPSAPLTGPLVAALIASQPAGGGPWGPVVINPSAKRPKEVNNYWTTDSVQRNVGHSLTAELKLSDKLSLTNIAAYRKAFVTSGNQIDGLGGLLFTEQAVVPYATFVAFSRLGTVYPTQAAAAAAIPGLASSLENQVGNRFIVVSGNAQFRGQQWSNELRFNYNSELLTLTAGAVYFHSKDQAGAPYGLNNTFSFSIFPANGRIPLGNLATSFNKSTSIAAYSQAELHATQKLDLVGGIRITHEKKSGTYVSGGAFVPATPGSFTSGTLTGLSISPFLYKGTKPNFSLGVNYKPDRDILVYGKYSTSYVSGGSIGGADFVPETVASWEAGVKADLLGRRVRTNLALFDATYQHLQSAQSGRNAGRPELGTVIVSQGRVKARGFEFEGTVLPVEGLTLNSSLGYIDVKYEPVNPILLASTGNGEFLPTLIPKWTSNLSAQYETQPLFGATRALLRIDANWRSKMRLEPNPLRIAGTALEALTFSPASWVLNARFALRDVKIGFAAAEIAFWARNLNDNKSPVAALNYGFQMSSTFQPARTYGMDFIIKL